MDIGFAASLYGGDLSEGIGIKQCANVMRLKSIRCEEYIVTRDSEWQV